MKLFSVDSPVFKFFSRLWDIIKLNFCWLICSLPIVTIGASTAAAFSITLHMVEDTEGYIVKPFFKAFKDNLKKGIPMGIIFLVGCYALYMLIQFAAVGDKIGGAFDKFQGVFLALAILLGVMLYFGFVYSFALLSRYENGLFATIANSFHIGIRYFGKTILLLIIIAVEIALFIWNWVLLAIGSLIAPACIMLTISGFAMKFFREIEKEPGAVTNQENDPAPTDEYEELSTFKNNNEE